MFEAKKIQIAFTANTEVGEYRDAIYVDYDEYQSALVLKPDIEVAQSQDDYELNASFLATIEAEQQNRINGWVNTIKNPPVTPEPTPEDITIQIDSITQMVDNLEVQKNGLISLKNELVPLTPEEIQAQIEKLEQRSVVIEEQKSQLSGVLVEAIAIKEQLQLEESMKSIPVDSGVEKIING